MVVVNMAENMQEKARICEYIRQRRVPDAEKICIGPTVCELSEQQRRERHERKGQSDGGVILKSEQSLNLSFSSAFS